jgi:hypothetical protein
MKPFTIEAWKAGEEIRTRDGRKVTELVCFQEALLIYPFAGVIAGDTGVSTWATSGLLFENEENDEDLVVWDMGDWKIDGSFYVKNLQFWFTESSKMLRDIAEEQDYDKRISLYHKYSWMSYELIRLMNDVKLTREMLEERYANRK